MGGAVVMRIIMAVINIPCILCRDKCSEWRNRLGSVAILSICLLACSGCGATITVNVLSSHSRYGQAIGGTNTTIKGQIEGGGALTATVPLQP